MARAADEFKILSVCQSEAVEISSSRQIETVARAPAKVILCGEHAVVEGATAVAAAIPFFTQARLRRFLDPSHGVISLELPTRNLYMSWELGLVEEVFIKEIKTDPRMVRPCAEETLAAIKKLVKEQLPCDVEGGLALGISAFMFLFVSILGLQPAIATVTTEIPIGSGLGSSSAFCVSLSGALLASISQLQYDNNSAAADNTDWYKATKDGLELINKWAFEGEKIIHGKPSGIDNTVSTFGSIIKYKQGSVIRLEPKRPLKILVTNTNVERNTKALINAINTHAINGTTSSYIKAIDILSEEAFNILQSTCDDGIESQDATAESGSLERERKEELQLGNIFAENQQILQSMGVSHAAIDDICFTTSRYSLQSKLTGGGGGGCVITLLPSDIGPDILDKLMVDLSLKSFRCWQVEIGCEGIQIMHCT